MRKQQAVTEEAETYAGGNADGFDAWRDEVRTRALAPRPRRQAPAPRWLRRTALLVVLVLHLAMIAALRDAMRVPARQPETAIDVVLLGPAEALPSPPPAPQPPPLHATVRAAPGPRTRARPIVAQPSATAAPDSSTQAPALKVFNPDGTVWQPARPLAPASTPFELARELMYRGHNIVHCRRTMFADGYRFDESVGDRIARRYLSWIGLYGEAAAERLKRRLVEAVDACDGL